MGNFGTLKWIHQTFQISSDQQQLRGSQASHSTLLDCAGVSSICHAPSGIGPKNSIQYCISRQKSANGFVLRRAASLPADTISRRRRRLPWPTIVLRESQNLHLNLSMRALRVDLSARHRQRTCCKPLTTRQRLLAQLALPSMTHLCLLQALRPTIRSTCPS